MAVANHYIRTLEFSSIKQRLLLLKKIIIIDIGLIVNLQVW